MGTGAELLRLTPVLNRLKEYALLLTNQNELDLKGLHPSEVSRVPGFGGTLSLLSGAWRFREVRSQLRTKLRESKPETVVYHGDTVTTLAASMASKAEGLTGAHVEAGCRSGSLWQPFPEEWCRRGADGRSEVLFAPSQSSLDNLSGHKRAILSGSTVWDNVHESLQDKTTRRGGYALMTCHRYENIIVRSRLKRVMEIARLPSVPLLWPVHEMTKARLKDAGLWEEAIGLGAIDLMPYPDFLELLARCAYVVTDGGGLEEEACILRKRCILLRSVTEKPEMGSKRVGLSPRKALSRIREAEAQPDDLPPKPDPWYFGRSPSEIIAEALTE